MNGILMKPWKIQAIRDNPDREWQTRRLSGLKGINKAPGKWSVTVWKVDLPNVTGAFVFSDKEGHKLNIKPRYKVGQVVYLKEAWCEEYYGQPIRYKLDGGESPGPKGFWRSPLSLKAVNARYFIRVTAVRAERFKLASLPPEELQKEGGAEATKILKDYDGKWLFAYSFLKADRPDAD